jgi:hypothetical protein
MKTKSKIIIALILIIFVIYFVPFTSVNQNTVEYQYCRYRLAVYEFWYIESEGEGEGTSDVFGCSIRFVKKIGGPLEYFGFREIEKGKR